MTPIVLFILVLVALATAATMFGVDSRDGSDDQRRSPYPTGLR